MTVPWDIIMEIHDVTIEGRSDPDSGALGWVAPGNVVIVPFGGPRTDRRINQSVFFGKLGCAEDAKSP